MLVIFLEAIIVIISVMLIGGIIYLVSKGKIFKQFYHNIMGWHLPSDEPQKFDMCNIHAKCKICGKSIMQDSQGNWF